MKLISAAVISCAIGSTGYSALLVTFEVRPVLVGLTANSSPGTIIDPSGHCAILQPGGSVVLQLVATLNAQNANTTDDIFTRTDGSLLTINTIGSPTGQLRTDNLAFGINNVEPFRGTGADSGAPLELSSPVDGILDLGGTSTTAFTGYFTASSNAPTGVVGQQFILGETVLTMSGEGTTRVTYAPRLGVGGTVSNRSNVIFRVDNVAYSLNGDGSGTGGAADAFSFIPVELSWCPEPSAFGMLLLGAFAIFGSQRLGNKKA
jgi:hypothetical protein